jgi:nucleotide-binding universal stress UspA family protein
MSIVVGYPSITAGGPLLEAGVAQSRCVGTELVLMHLIRLEPVASGAQVARQQRRLESTHDFLASAAEESCAPDVPFRVKLATTFDAPPATRLLERIHEEAPDLLVIGMRARGNRLAVLGDTGRALLLGARCPVLTVPLGTR